MFNLIKETKIQGSFSATDYKSAVLYWYFTLNQLNQSFRIHFPISICICLVILGILIAIWLTLWSSYQFKQQLPDSLTSSLCLIHFALLAQLHLAYPNRVCLFSLSSCGPLLLPSPSGLWCIVRRNVTQAMHKLWSILKTICDLLAEQAAKIAIICECEDVCVFVCVFGASNLCNRHAQARTEQQ